jgi:hypothetical protein
MCRLCLEAGHVTPATVADHIEPHGRRVERPVTSPLDNLTLTNEGAPA